MANNIKVNTKPQPDGTWYVDIVPPIYLSGSVAVTGGTLYFPKPFSSQEEAYEMAKTYLIALGISQETIDTHVDFN